MLNLWVNCGDFIVEMKGFRVPYKGATFELSLNNNDAKKEGKLFFESIKKSFQEGIDFEIKANFIPYS